MKRVRLVVEGVAARSSKNERRMLRLVSAYGR